jgi:hypothetical protein
MEIFNFWTRLNKDEVPAWVKRLAYKKRYGTHIYYGKEIKYRVIWVTKLNYSKGRMGHHMGQDTGMEYPVIKYPEYESKKI